MLRPICSALILAVGGCSPPKPTRDLPNDPASATAAEIRSSFRTNVLQPEAVRVCTRCGQEKELEAFAFRNLPAGRRHRRCKVCVAAYGRGHYALNRQAYIARNVSNMRVRRREYKARVWSYLAEHPCVDCGETDLVVLEFDHLDPRDKRLEIYWLVQSAYGWNTIVAEIEKCEVRCSNCHRRRTAVQFSWPRAAFTEGEVVTDGGGDTPTPRMRLLRPAVPRMPKSSGVAGPLLSITPGQQVCRWCGLARSTEEFNMRSRPTGSRHTVCGECFRAYRRAHYRLNREAYIQRNSRLLRERGSRWMRRLWEYLVAHPCVDCGESDPVVLEFDHVDPELKRQAVASWLGAAIPDARCWLNWRSVRCGARIATDIGRQCSSTGPNCSSRRLRS